MALFGFEFISSVRSTDRDSQRIATCASSEIDYFFGVGISVMFCTYLVFYTGKHTQLTFYCYIELVSIVHYFLSQSHILFVRQVRTVDHYRRKSHIDTRFAQFERIAVIEVQNDLRMFATQLFGIFHCTLCHITKQCLVGIVTSTFRNLENYRRFSFNRSLDNSL